MSVCVYTYVCGLWNLCVFCFFFLQWRVDIPIFFRLIWLHIKRIKSNPILINIGCYFFAFYWRQLGFRCSWFDSFIMDGLKRLQMDYIHTWKRYTPIEAMLQWYIWTCKHWIWQDICLAIFTHSPALCVCFLLFLLLLILESYGVPTVSHCWR